MCACVFGGAGLRPVIGWRAGKYSYKQFDNFLNADLALSLKNQLMILLKWRKCLSKDSLNLTL